MRALVIDDSRTMRRIIARTLQGAGFDVVEAGALLEKLGLLGLTPSYDVAGVLA